MFDKGIDRWKLFKATWTRRRSVFQIARKFRICFSNLFFRKIFEKSKYITHLKICKNFQISIQIPIFAIYSRATFFHLKRRSSLKIKISECLNAFDYKWNLSSLSLSRGRNIEDEKLGESLDRRKQVNEPINRNRIDDQLIHGQGDLFDEAWPGLHERLSRTDGAVDYNVGHAIRNGESGKSKFMPLS